MTKDCSLSCWKIGCNGNHWETYDSYHFYWLINKSGIVFSSCSCCNFAVLLDRCQSTLLILEPGHLFLWNICLVKYCQAQPPAPIQLQLMAELVIFPFNPDSHRTANPPEKITFSHNRFSVFNLEPLIVSQYSIWSRWSFLSNQSGTVDRFSVFNVEPLIISQSWEARGFEL